MPCHSYSYHDIYVVMYVHVHCCQVQSYKHIHMLASTVDTH